MAKIQEKSWNLGGIAPLLLRYNHTVQYGSHMQCHVSDHLVSYVLFFSYSVASYRLIRFIPYISHNIIVQTSAMQRTLHVHTYNKIIRKFENFYMELFDSSYSYTTDMHATQEQFSCLASCRTNRLFNSYIIIICIATPIASYLVTTS